MSDDAQKKRIIKMPEQPQHDRLGQRFRYASPKELFSIMLLDTKDG